MGKIGFRVSVDDNGVPKEIKKQIERGVRKATKRLAKRIKEEAEAEIRRKDATDAYGIWEGDLVGGFQIARKGDSLRVFNDDEAAGPMEHGVKPGAYGARGPPIENLLPWVRDHFSPDTSFDPWGIGGGENFDTTNLWSPDDSGATSGSRQRFTLPEGNRTQTGEEALSAQSGGSGGLTPRGVEDIKPGESFYNRQNRLWGYAEFDEFADDDYLVDTFGRRYHPDEFVGFAPGDLDPNDPDLSSLKKGDTLEWQFDGNTYTAVVSDPLHGDDHVEVDYEGVPHYVERELVTGFDPRSLPSWVPESWFQVDEDDPWDRRRTFYGQEIAVWDVNNGDYRQARVIDFEPSRVKIEFTDKYGGGSWVYTDNRRNNRLVAGERWSDLTEAEQMQSIEDYWDARVTREATISSTRLDWAKDYYFNEMFPRSKNPKVVKDTLQLLEEVKEVKDPITPMGIRMGSIEPKDNGKWDLSLLTESDWKKVEQRLKNPKPYEDTLSHEFGHAVLHSHDYEMGGQAYSVKHEWEVMMDFDFDKGGLQQASGQSVRHAAQMVFGDTSSGSRGAPLGFSRWKEYVYDEVHGGSGSDPGWDTSSAGSVERLVETVNRAWWKQTVWAQKEYQDTGSKVPEYHLRFTERAYAIKYAHETAATITQVLMAYDPTHSDYKLEARLKAIHQHYPWLLEEWLEHWEPIAEAATILEDLGYDV